MTGRAHNDGPRPDPPGNCPSSPSDLSPAAIVEQEQATLEAEGRTMADWLDRIVPIPVAEPSSATEVIRTMRDSDDAVPPTMEDVLRDADQYRRPAGPTSDEIVEALHEGREEQREQLNGVAAPGVAPRTPRSRHQ